MYWRRRRRCPGEILTAEEKITADDLYERILEVKDADGQTMIGTKVVAVFLKRRVQPIMSRAHLMWLYSGPKDETRVNAVELSDKELLDEVRRLTYFSQEDSIPLMALQDPYELTPQPAEVPAISIYYPTVPETEKEPEDDESTGNVEARAKVVEDSEVSEEEENNPFNPKAPSPEWSPSGQYDNDADRVLFVGAVPETSTAQPPKRPLGGFADEDELLFDSDEGCAEHPPPKKAKTSSSKQTSATVEVPPLPNEAPAAASLLKGKEIPSTATSSPSAPEGHQAAQSKSAQLDQAVKMAATAWQEADKLKIELSQLKTKLNGEEKEKAEAQIQVMEKEDNIRNSVKALLGAADIPANLVGKPSVDSAVDAISFAVDSNELVRVTPVAPFVESPSAAGYESDLVKQMRSRISRMEKDLLVLADAGGITSKRFTYGAVLVDADGVTSGRFTYGVVLADAGGVTSGRFTYGVVVADADGVTSGRFTYGVVLADADGVTSTRLTYGVVLASRRLAYGVVLADAGGVTSRRLTYGVTYVITSERLTYSVVPAWRLPMR
ncbi:hypothetical protein QYE76_025440 [Lolium multiflorum]|uniref:Uncharacterized protein n=1 Tax=Lolium multiflorum TaxID=4521 RepID=A0AAD8VX10_LOLMU|nr:hypothetical protein QYE76_025440 [Lolium multiflorum]